MRSIALIGLLAGATFLSSACAVKQTRAAAPALDAFAEEVAARHGLDAAQVRALLSQAEYQQSIIDAITRPAEKLPWYKYRPIFLKPERIDAGVEFWRDNAELLEKVSTDYAVPPEIIVAIVGVETFYGRHKGKYRVIDALTTLGFNYPPRETFFRSELEQFLLLAREEKLDPLTPVGSYAGAMGMPQFIASSYRRYAVDGDGDGRRDLWESKPDILASVANYFQRHGWRPGEPVASPAQVSGDKWQALLSNDLALNARVGELAAAGVTTATPQPSERKAKLLALESAADSNEYWVAYNNFYVITRYNRSPLYAMAVYQLAEAIRERYENSR